MDQCRKIEGTFPLIDSPTLFVAKDGSATYLGGNKLAKYKAKEIIDMLPQVKTGEIKVYICWQGNWRTDIFELEEKDIETYREKLVRYIEG